MLTVVSTTKVSGEEPEVQDGQITAARIFLSTRALLLLAVHWGEHLLTKEVKDAIPEFMQKFIRLNATERFHVQFSLTESTVPTEIQAEALAKGGQVRPRVPIVGYDQFPSRLGRDLLGRVAWGTSYVVSGLPS